MKKKEIIIALSSFTLVLLFLVRELNLYKMWTFADLLPFPIDVSHRMEETFYIWSNEGIGGIISPMTNIVRFILVLQLIFDPVTAQKISIFLPFLIGFIFQYILLKNLGLSIPSSYIASLFFMINPHTISSFIVGDIGTIMMFAIFPLLIFLLNKFLFENKEINWRHLSILCIMIFLLFWNIYHAIWSIIFSFTFLLILNIDTVRKERKYLQKLIQKILILLLMIILINMPTFFIISLLNRDISPSSNVITSQTNFSYGDADILNLVRITGNKGSPEIKGYLDYNSLNWFTVFGYILTSIALFSFVIMERSKLPTLLKSSGILFLIIIGNILLIKFFPIITEKFILFATLRNPSKLLSPLVLFFSIMLAIGIDNILEVLNKNRRHRYLCVIFIFLTLVSIIFYDYPGMDGTLGVGKMTGSVYIPRNYEIEDSYTQLNNFLSYYDKNFSEYDIIFLPWERFSKNMITRNIPNYVGLGTGSSSFSNINNGFRDLYDIMSFNPDNKAQLLRFFNVKYVIIDKKFESMFPGYRNTNKISAMCDNLNSCWYVGDYKIFRNMFKNDRNFELIYEDDKFVVFNNLVLDRPMRIHKENLNIINQNLTFIPNYKFLFSASFENDLDNFTTVGDHNLSKDFIDGNDSLVLFAKNEEWPHIYKNISIDENKIYRLSFNIKGHNITNLHAKLLWYNAIRNIYKDDTDTIRSDYIKIYENDIKDDEWYDSEETLISPENSKSVIIVILGSQAISKTKNFSSAETFVDNVSFVQILGSSNIENGIADGVEDQIQYKRIDPTQWNIKIRSNDPFILTLNQMYDPLWEAKIYKDNRLIERTDSIPIYSIINGFRINQTGNLDIIIRYQPQDWFKVSSMIPIIVFIICTSYLIYDLRKNKKGVTIDKK